MTARWPKLERVLLLRQPSTAFGGSSAMISARAALLYGPGQDYKIDTIELDEPGPGEVLVEMRACGMCHSDEHVRSGDLPLPHYPVINGHEGAGGVAKG